MQIARSITIGVVLATLAAMTLPADAAEPQGPDEGAGPLILYARAPGAAPVTDDALFGAILTIADAPGP